MDIWEHIKQALAGQIHPDAYRNWVAGTHFGRLENQLLCVNVPDESTRDWMIEEYSDAIWGVIRENHFPVRQVLYEVHSNGAIAEAPGQPAGPGLGPLGATLNAKFTFSNFVVGSCNQFAHAAAHAVATLPSRSYNPLFIYGGVGMGKTHLMHAIGRALMDNYPGMRIVYTSSERFMNEMISCIKTDRMSLFHRHYRLADALLVDDIQILAGKERTQDEFFHTFNELYDHQKQIVISSDSSPKNITGLVERLRSRFEWGLMVDVQPPDLETKMAILDKKAEADGIQLPQDVRVFLATKTKSNVRELEGALVKLIAYASVTKEPISLAMAQQVLKHILPAQDKRITVEQIVRAVAEKYELLPAQLKQKTNARHIALPRQVAMYLIKELTHASLPEIGRYFGGKHHTTVLHSIQKIERERQKDPDLNRLIHSLLDSIQA